MTLAAIEAAVEELRVGARKSGLEAMVVVVNYGLPSFFLTRIPVWLILDALGVATA